MNSTTEKKCIIWGTNLRSWNEIQDPQIVKEERER